MTSDKKIAANQNNAKKSAGARTKAGKEHSKLNARTHGIFAKELLIPDKDKPQFEVLQSSLRAQLKPASTLQHIAVEKILAACWRYKLATRLRDEAFRQPFSIDRECAASRTSKSDSRTRRDVELVYLQFGRSA